MTKRQEPDADHAGDTESFSDILLQAVTDGPAMISITDAAGHFVFVNKRYLDLTNYTREELLGKRSSVLKAGTLPDNLFSDLWKTVRSGHEWRGEFHNKRKDGSVFWESALIAPIRNSEGQITHYLKVAEDISLRKKTEQDLLSSNEALKANAAMLRDSYAKLEQVTKALEESERRFRYISNVDSLTGLLNRRGFDEELRRMLALARRHGRGRGILVMDIDRFKTINDSHSHAIGDLVLREFAGRLTSGLRATDVLCRHGGDEFIAALPLVTSEETLAAAERIRRMAEEKPFGTPDLTFPVTVSIGAVWTPPSDREGNDELFSAADQALYDAKRSGRNRVSFRILESDRLADAAPSGPHKPGT